MNISSEYLILLFSRFNGIVSTNFKLVSKSFLSKNILSEH